MRRVARSGRTGTTATMARTKASALVETWPVRSDPPDRRRHPARSAGAPLDGRPGVAGDLQAPVDTGEVGQPRAHEAPLERHVGASQRAPDPSPLDQVVCLPPAPLHQLHREPIRPVVRRAHHRARSTPTIARDLRPDASRRIDDGRSTTCSTVAPATPARAPIVAGAMTGRSSPSSNSRQPHATLRRRSVGSRRSRGRSRRPPTRPSRSPPARDRGCPIRRPTS